MAIAVMVTIPKDSADNLAKNLLQEKVCACVNVIHGVNSYYWWEGKIDDAHESLLIIKTKESLFHKLKTMIKNNHPYSVPEIIGFNISQIDNEYLRWLNEHANADPTSR